MDNHHFEAYWQARLAFWDRPNARIATAIDDAGTTTVHINEVNLAHGKRYGLSYKTTKWAYIGNKYVHKWQANEARAKWDKELKPKYAAWNYASGSYSYPTY